MDSCVLASAFHAYARSKCIAGKSCRVKKPLIVRLNGGLGNNLFQLGFGRLCMGHTDRDVEFDMTGVPDSQRKKLTWLLQGNWTERTGSAVSRFYSAGVLPFTTWKDRQLRLLSRMFSSVDYQMRFAPLPEVSNESPSRYYSGYFQDHRVVDILRRELSQEFHSAVDGWRIRLKAEYPERPLVALHIRLGDYLTPSALTVHGMLPISYYSDAISEVTDLLGRRGPDAVFIVFTNDPDGARSRLASPLSERAHIIFSDHWSGNDIDDFCAMSACDAHIVANSTFSYWPAILSTRSVARIAPLDWFGLPELNQMTGQLFNDRWHRV